ncbi:MAG: hypothetical protein GIX03_06615 [Candidatus Eremiobacteraeota bacterium]|nr:hypothetical protein [Candidatus Eremiobacteraeota bacterium]MBC5802666.1 hypothetical protein [Candidatus Eremiobacteraeota bacterium]MBC5822033.1 hypothetical protein [Candidatus Eremiobacteraeota bacterium]
MSRPLSRRFFLAPAAALCVIAGAVAPQPAFAIATPNDTYPALVVASAPALTLDFTTMPWTNAKPITTFETLTTRTQARYATIARILFDGSNVYVAIHCEQRGTPIVTTQTTNNVGFGLDDFAGVGIDTTGNGQAYYFEVTPRGVRYQQAAESSRYNPFWTALAATQNGNWDALLVIPFAVLRTQNAPVQRWRVNIVRHIAALNENETWAYDPLMSDAGGNGFPQFGDARFWPYVDGIKVRGRAIRPKPRAELYALASAGGDRNIYQSATQLFAPQGTRNFGLDVNVPLTGTIAFVGALAPDFSNVEVDQQTISPQEFRRNLTEYRPFFAQGANYFAPISQTGINQAPNAIFYSPGIGPFTRGAKIEGTYGNQSIGVLNVEGAGFNDSVIAFKHSLPDRTFGYSFDAVSAHHQDGNLTAYPFADSDVTYDAMVGGRNLHNGLVYTAEYAAEDGTSVPGTSPRLAYKSEDFLDVHKQNYEVFTEYRDIGPKWNPIDGFTNVADIRGPGAFFDLSGNPPKQSPLKRAELFVFGDRLSDGSGAVHQADFQLNADLVFKNLLHLSGGPSFSALRLYGNGTALVGYDLGYTGGVTVPFNSHGFSVGYKDGTPTPYDFATSWGPFETFNGDGTVRPTYLRQYSFTTSRPLGQKLTLGLEYDGTLEAYPTQDANLRGHDGQQLRRISLGEALGPESNLSVSLRSISGTGGFALPGLNLAASYHRRFRNDSELFVNYGTPAATATLQRVIVKYVFRTGSGAGT